MKWVKIKKDEDQGEDEREGKDKKEQAEAEINALDAEIENLERA